VRDPGAAQPHHALPRERLWARCHGAPDGARAPGQARAARHLPVGRDASARDAPDHAVDPGEHPGGGQAPGPWPWAHHSPPGSRRAASRSAPARRSPGSARLPVSQAEVRCSTSRCSSVLTVRSMVAHPARSAKLRAVPAGHTRHAAPSPPQRGGPGPRRLRAHPAVESAGAAAEAASAGAEVAGSVLEIIGGVLEILGGLAG